MKISERYRHLISEIEHFRSNRLAALAEDPAQRMGRQLEKAIEQLAEFREDVGEIPQIKLESKLSTPLLKAHFYLDQARLGFEEAGNQRDTEQVWELEQKIYRLLNDL